MTVFQASSDARPGHGGAAGISPPPVTAPILTDTNVNFGLLTRTARGGVNLNQQDETTTADHPVTFSGFGLMSPSGPPCDTLTDFEFVSNTAGRTGSDFTMPTSGTAMASAISPVPSSSGQGHLAGNYVFRARCSADGNLSNWANITYTGIDNAVNIGSADRTDFGVYPSGFGNVAGAKILFSTGYYNRGNITLKQGGTFTNQVTVQNADANKLANIASLTIGSTSNVKVYGLVASGNQATAMAAGARCTFCTGIVNGVSYSDVVLDNVHGYFSEALMGTTPDSSWIGFGDFAGCTSGCQITNSGIDYTESGMSFANGTSGAISNVWLRHIFNNFLFFQNSGTASTGWDLTDLDLIAPSTGSKNYHPDFGQICDQCTPFNTNIKHLIQAQMEGVQGSQGTPFGGGPIGVGDNVKGYVDDGTAGHGPGKKLILTSGVFGFGANGARIWSPAGSPVALTDYVKMSCPSGCSGATSADLALASDVNIGSPEAPVNWYGIAALNFNINGVVYDSGEPRGISWTGENGTSSYTNYAAINDPANPFYETSFTGTIASDILTIAGPITNNIPTTIPPYYIAGTFATSGGRLKYGACDYCSASIAINYQITGTQRGTFTGSQSGTTLHVTTNPTGGEIQVGDIISGGTIPVPTGTCASGCVWTLVKAKIATQGGDVATYTVSTSQTVGSATLTAGPTSGPGTYRLNSAPGDVGPIAMSSSTSFGSNAGGSFIFSNCSTANLHGGTLTIDSGYATSISTTSCPNLTYTNGLLNSDLTADDYASGMLPKDYLNQFSFAQRVAFTNLDVRRVECLAFKPAMGGALDMGDGKWYGPFTGATSEDGTGGGDWISEYNGANAYKSDGTHITGCEAAP